MEGTIPANKKEVTTPLTEEYINTSVSDIKNYIKGNSGNNWGILGSNKQTIKRIKRGCFGTLPGSVSGSMYPISAAVLGVGLKANLSDTNLLEYVEYILTRSPWSDAFLDKDPKEVLRYGSQVNIELPGPYVICAVQEIRKVAGYGNSNRIKAWLKIREAVGEVAGDFIAYFLNYSSRTNSYRSVSSSYGWLQPATKSNFTNFVNNKKYFDKYKPMRDKVSYFDQRMVWYESEKQYNEALKFALKFDTLPHLSETSSIKDSFGQEIRFTKLSVPVEEYAARVVEANYLGTEYGK